MPEEIEHFEQDQIVEYRYSFIANCAKMESSGGLLPLLEGAIPIARPSSLKSKKETVAQSDIDHANIQRLVAFNESMPWPTVYEDCPDYKERKVHHSPTFQCLTIGRFPTGN